MITFFYSCGSFRLLDPDPDPKHCYIERVPLNSPSFACTVMLYSEPHLEDFLVEASLLGEHLELPGVRVLVDLEVRLHDPQLVVLK